jgi:hypothetical protein
MDSLITRFKKKLKDSPKVIREVLYGFTAYELHRDLKKEKGNIDNLFMLVIFGDLAGLPLLPPYYSMRLLPYIIPRINMWKRSLLRERDITDVLVE